MKVSNNRHDTHSYYKVFYRFFLACIIVSIGVIVTSSGGGWDISNHLLNKPESFFTPPHSMMYSGVAISLAGSILCFLSYRKLNNIPSLESFSRVYRRPAQFALVGMLMVVFAGPFDYTWHNTFGLDGLLSPSHFMLTLGLVVASSFSMVGIVRLLQCSFFFKKKRQSKDDNLSKQQYDQQQRQNQDTVTVDHNKYSNLFCSMLVILSIIPVWLSMSGILYMFSLPFSNTEFFKFNPDPTAAVLVASLGYPFLVSLMLTLSGYLGKFRFGTVSLTGAVFIIIGVFTSILPNDSLKDSLPFYLAANMVIFVSADAIMSHANPMSPKGRIHHNQPPVKNTPRNHKKEWSRSILFFVGAALPACGFMFTYFPLITYVYNEVMAHIQFYPHQLSTVYFDLLAKVLPVEIIPAASMGILACVFAKKITNKITMQAQNSKLNKHL